MRCYTKIQSLPASRVKQPLRTAFAKRSRPTTVQGARSTRIYPLSGTLLSRLRNHTLILPRFDILQRPQEVFLRILQTRRVRLPASLQIRMDELDQAVEVFRRDLNSQRSACNTTQSCQGSGSCRAYRLVLLIEVIDITIKDLDE
jgi:hypothetical protein